ncbi:MAG: deoxyguanosinetriphosphate triphosphohydrolase, partial [Limisphaerales bacterium]
PKALVQHSPERRELNLELRDYLYKNLYYNPIVHKPNLRAVKMLEQLFSYFLKRPKEIGWSAQKRLKKTGLHRAVCDYLAGMTDRYVLVEYRRIFGRETKF